MKTKPQPKQLWSEVPGHPRFGQPVKRKRTTKLSNVLTSTK